jgi:RNA polymerase sigma-70 factor, ECF subfamily
MTRTTYPDPVAFETLVREHQAGLRAFIRSLGADTAWVDDLAQEAFLVAFRRWKDLEEEADFGRWLRGIARKLTANERRKNARRHRLLPFVISDLLWRQERKEEAFSLDREEMLAIMQACMNRLSQSGQALLRLRYSENRKAGELAAELRTSADAIRQNLSRLRQAVKQCVEEKWQGVWP